MEQAHDDVPNIWDTVLSLPTLGTSHIWSQPQFGDLNNIDDLANHPALNIIPSPAYTQSCNGSDSSWLSWSEQDALGPMDINPGFEGEEDTPSSSTSPRKFLVDIAPGHQSGTQAKPHPRFSTDSTRILKSWFYQHRDDPYPSDCEKLELVRQTGLNLKQISNWFINARRRIGKGQINGHYPKPNQLDSSPLERWKNSPPETEAAATSDIIRALELVTYSSSDSLCTQLLSQDTWSSNSSSVSFILGAPSAGSLEHSQSSGSEVSFNKSQLSFQRPPTPLPRRRSHRRRKFNRAKAGAKTDARRPYQCTFCSDTFLSKYDWQRHEKALHLLIDLWVCAPEGGIIDINGIATCIFCGTPNPDLKHLESHNVFTCQEKSPEQRTFTRKDHLKQHLKSAHAVAYQPSMDRWRETRNDIVSRCGFCGVTFSTWGERVDHVAAHFKLGADMIQWKGDWGFDPAVQELVENALPPYLLGFERHSVDPWKMTGMIGCREEDKNFLMDDDIPNALNRYTNLQGGLTIYIRNQLAAGYYPSDQELQHIARHIAFGYDDPFDQTYADDPVWLFNIKRDAGLLGCEPMPPPAPARCPGRAASRSGAPSGCLIQLPAQDTPAVTPRQGASSTMLHCASDERRSGSSPWSNKC